MKLLAPSLIIVVLFSLIACGEEEKMRVEQVPEEKIHHVEDSSIIDSNPVIASDSLKASNRPSAEELLESFLYCRESAENSLTCKYFIAKAICQYYGISDFENANGQYMDFEMILPAIKENPNWIRAGNASEQTVLDQAINAVNAGRAAIAVSEKDLYGHVVLILPGTPEKAPAWGGLNCPQVASFFMIPGLQPFVNRSIAYAWSKPDGIAVYIRK